MSIAVAPEDLADAVEGLGMAYLLTLGDRPRPHVGSVRATVVDGGVRITEVAAPEPSAGVCASDCVELPVEAPGSVTS